MVMCLENNISDTVQGAASLPEPFGDRDIYGNGIINE